MKQLPIITISILLLSVPIATLASNNSYTSAAAAGAVQNTSTAPQTKKATIVPKNKYTEYLNKILLAEIAINRSQPQVALTNYIWVAKETQDARVAKRATQIAMSLGSLKYAEEAAIIWARAEPKNLEAQITISAILIRSSKPESSIEFLKKVQKITPLDANQHFMILYKQLSEKNDKQNVVSALQGLFKQQPKNYNAALALGEIYLDKGENKEALKISQKAIKINPRVHTALILHTDALIANEQHDEALAFIQDSMAKNKDNLPLKQYYVEYLFKQGKGESAYNEVKILAEKATLPPQQLLNLARLSMEAKWYKESELFLKKAAIHKSYEDTANYFLARLYETQDKSNDSIQWYKKVKKGPFHIISVIRASMLLSDLKKYDEALELVKSAKPITHSDLKQLSVTQVEILSAAKRPKEAIALLTTHLQLVPHDTDLLYSRALMYEKVGNIWKAEQDLKRILRFKPKNADALNALGYILTVKTNRYDEAYKYLSKALEQAPNSASILDSYGWLQYKMGNNEEAIKYLKKALSIMPNPEIAAHLGEVLWKMQKTDEALKVWQDALKENPSHESLIKTMDKFTGNN